MSHCRYDKISWDDRKVIYFAIFCITSCTACVWCLHCWTAALDCMSLATPPALLLAQADFSWPVVCVIKPRVWAGFSGLSYQWTKRHFFVTAWNCWWPIFFAFLTVSTAKGSAICLLSRTNRSLLCSSNRLPSSSITLTSEETSFLNAFCALVVWSWWSTSSHLLMS